MLTIIYTTSRVLIQAIRSWLVSKTSDTKYNAPSCKTLQGTGVCPGGNALCHQISHPLSYYFVRGETEKGNDTRWGRILTASLHIAGKSFNNIERSFFNSSKYS